MAPMASEPDRAARQRRYLPLSAVMFSILLVSIAAAWLLVRAKAGNSARGAEIIHQIRSEGLAKYWPEAGVDLTYLYKDSSGQIQDGFIVTRGRVKGGYAGGKTVPGEIREVWRISEGADMGEYTGPTRKKSPSQTRIVLHDGLVRVGQLVEVRQGRWAPKTVESPAPPNYIPEGLTDLAIRLTAAEAEKATFRTIYNPVAISGDQVRFIATTMTPLGPNSVRVSGPGDPDTIYHLDTRGTVVRIEHKDGREFQLERQGSAPLRPGKRSELKVEGESISPRLPEPSP